MLSVRSVCRATGAAGTYVWGGLCRIDVLDAPLTTSLAFYGSKTLRVQAMPLREGTLGEQLLPTSHSLHRMTGFLVVASSWTVLHTPMLDLWLPCLTCT